MGNIGIKIISILLTALIIPFSLIPLIIKNIFGNLILSLLLGVVVWKLLPISYLLGFLVVLIFFTILNIILDYILIKESFINQFSSTYGSFKFSQLIQKYKKPNEKFKVSPIISVNDKNYRVIEFGTYNFNPTDSKKLTGFLALTEEGKLLQDSNFSNELVNLYLFWRKIYFDPILGKDIKKNHKPLLKSWLDFQDKFKDIIEKRQKNDYKKISNVKNEEFVKILKELDTEVLDQYPFVTNKIKISLEIFDKIYDIFLYPSKEFYQETFNKINKIANISNEENKIWTKRLKTWENLYKHYRFEINKMSEPKFKWLFIGVLGDLIDFFVLKQHLYPIGGATIAGLTVEGSKKVKKETLKYLNHTLLYHKTGIDTIKNNIEVNKRLKNVRDEYKRILSSNNTSKIRN